MNKTFTLLGADYALMKQHNAWQAIRRYRYAAFALLIIGIFSFCSVYYAMDILFQSLVVEWVLAAYLTILFLLMYVLLLNTFTKASFSTETTFTLSNASRCFFVLFMAFILSKPVEVYLLKSHHEGRVANYRISLLDQFSNQVHKIHASEILEMDQKIKSITRQQAIYPTKDGLSEIASLGQRIATFRLEEQMAIQDATKKIHHSEFMLHRMHLAARDGVAWLVCLSVMTLFMLPGYLVYSLPKDDNYIIAKKQKELVLIKREFEDFLLEYYRIFKELGLDHVRYSTPFADPPFNTIRKIQSTYAENDSFLDKYGPLY